MERLVRVWSWAFCLLCLCSYHVLSFNVDVRTATIHRGPAGTMFGFDVAQHRDNQLGWLLVGAPKAQTDQPDVEMGGAVFRCSPEVVSTCQQIPFDRTGSNRLVNRGEHVKSDEKSHQWFGATVYSSGENGMVVACAPRYVYFSTNFRRRDPVGSCWVSRSSFQGFQEYAPCKSSAWGYHRQGSCQAGISATISKDGRRLFIGAVGSWYWQGQVFSQDLLSRQTLHSTNESPASEDDSYLGYSISTGEFTGDNEPDVVVGMPRGNNLTGKVVLYNAGLHNLHNISGEQVGSYFGHSLATADVNGDGLDDIIVGAPLYTDLQAKDGSFEKGRVHVIYQTKQHDFKKTSLLDGKESKGRFGLSVASLKDINRDGFQDIAVGAPYGGEDGRGLIFIFHGSKDGIQDKPSQVLSAKEFGDPMLKTFGFSISAGMDMDNNEYPDILVGAYESDQAVFMRSRPVVTVTSSLKAEPEKINLNDRGCSLKEGTHVSCVIVSFCIEYSGVGVETQLDLQYRIRLDTTKKQSRVFFLTNEQKSAENVTIRIRKEAKHCNSIYLYIRNNVRDKLTPIAIGMSIHLVEKPVAPGQLVPILDQTVETNLTKYIHVQKSCGKDNVCIPDLKLSVLKNLDFVLVGGKEKLEFDVTILNKGEDAFEAMMFLKMPLDVSYININKSKSSSHVSCTGASPDRTGENILACDIGNPLQANKTVKFKVLIAPFKIVSATSDFFFEFSANSTNAENHTSLFDNAVSIKLPIQVEADLRISGQSEPNILRFNSSDDAAVTEKITEFDIGPEVIHKYEVGNTGLSVIHSTDIYLLWPSRTLAGKHLLYLLDKPRIVGDAHCQPVAGLNPERIRMRVEPRRGTSISVGDLTLKTPDDSTEVENYTIPVSKIKRSISKELEDELVCGLTQCTKIRCTITNLSKGSPVTFIIRSRVWMDTVREIGYDNLQISSKIVARVVSLPYDVKPDYLGIRTHSVSVEMLSEDSDRGQQYVPLWIIILAVCGGLLLLGLLALLLWRLGFFKRKRPEENEHLYRPEKNGYKLAKDEAVL